MICKNCNAINEDGARFCFNCGSHLENQDLPQKEQGYIKDDILRKTKIGKRNNVPILVIGIAVVVVLIVVAVLYFTGNKDDVETEKANTVEVTDAVDNTYDTSEEETITPTISPGGNIVDEAEVFSNSEIKYFDELIGEFETKNNLSIVLYIKSECNDDLSDIAQDVCVEFCGDNGLVLLLDLKHKKSAVAATGTGEKFKKRVKESKVTQQVDGYLDKKDYFNGCKKGMNQLFDPVTLLGFESVEDAEQVIYVKKNKNSTTGKMTVVEWNDEEADTIFEIDKVYLGMDGITSSPSESKSATPKGTFKLGFAFSDHYLDTNLDTELISSGAVWVNDPYSRYYNTLQYGSTSNSAWSSAENTYDIFNSGYNDACILIEHNGDGYVAGESGKGSCIYIAGKNTGLSRSYGDVNITADQMKTLLSFLDEDKNPHIVIS